jgi:hypothetical protein
VTAVRDGPAAVPLSSYSRYDPLMRKVASYPSLLPPCMVRLSVVKGPHISRKVRLEDPMDLGSKGGAVRVGGVVQLVHPPLTVLLVEVQVPPQPPCPRPFTS